MNNHTAGNNPLARTNRFKGWSNLFVLLAFIVPMVLAAIQTSVAYAAPILTITPLTWNVVGLDSNNVLVGPENFPVGARVCETGGTDAATQVQVDFVWDDGLDDYAAVGYINLRSSPSYTNSSFPSPISPSTITIAANSCKDFYFEVTITRNAAAYFTSRDYHITADSLETSVISTPIGREIYVEKLISQNRNGVLDVKLDGVSVPVGGTMNLVLGNTYTITLIAKTATAYEQIESFINFDNTIFQVNSVSTTYVDDGGTDPLAASRMYADGCAWDNATRSCTGVGKYGGPVTVIYNVTIVDLGPSASLSTLIYDFSGSSYHYNNDFPAGRKVKIIDPNACTAVTIAEWTFAGSVITPSTDAAVGTPTITVGAGVQATAFDTTVTHGNPQPNAHWGDWPDVLPGTPATTTENLEIGVNTSGYFNVGISYDFSRDHATGPTSLNFYYSSDGGTSYTQDPGTDTTSAPATGANVWGTNTRDFSAVSALDNLADARFRFLAFGSGSDNNARDLALDNIKITGCKLPATLNLDKEADSTTFTIAGESVIYTYTLTNAGSVDIVGPFTISDDTVTGVVNCSVANAASPLVPGESSTCTVTYLVDFADMDVDGCITNLATANGDTIIGDDIDSNQASEEICQAQTLTLEKVWIDGKNGDQVTLNAEIITIPITGTPFQSTVGDLSPADETDTDDPVIVQTGEIIDLYESWNTGDSTNYISTLSCDGNDSATDGELTIDVTDVTVTCTFTNERREAQLVLEKDWVTAVNGDQSTLVASVESTEIDSFLAVVIGATPATETDTDLSPVTVYAGDTVVLGETLDPGNTGIYDMSFFVCTGGGSQPPDTNYVTILYLDEGNTITCTITNTAQYLTIVKYVTNDNGGTLVADDFSIALNAAAVTFGAGVDEGGGTTSYSTGAIPVGTGTNTLFEDNAVPGYSAGDWSCDNLNEDSGAPNDTDVLIAVGENVTCTITNDDDPGTIIIEKQTIPDADPEDFEFDISYDLANFFLNDGETDNSGSLDAGNYTVDEVNLPAGWALTDIACDDETDDSGTGQISIALANGETVTCTFTNTYTPPSATITIVKTVTNDNGGTAEVEAFDIELNNTDVTFPDANDTGTAPTITYSSDPISVTPGQQNLAETLPAGYAATTDWTCEDSAGLPVTVDPDDPDDATVDIADGDDVTCYITNDDIAPELTLYKYVTNDYNGPDTADDWTLNANTGGGADELSGSDTEAHPGVTSNSTFQAGTYVLSETSTSGSTGYTLDTLSCTDESGVNIPLGGANNDEVTLAVGDEVFCSFANSDSPATITIIKTVVNDNGGTLTADDFDILVNSAEPTFTEDATNAPTYIYTTDPISVDAGTVNLSEDDETGYTEGTWSCYITGSDPQTPVAVSPDAASGAEFTIGNGENVTCEITNNDEQGSLQIVKIVTNDNGGTADAVSFQIEVEDVQVNFTDFDADTPGPNQTTSSTDAVPVDAGTYDLSELDLAGYLEGDWTCDNDGEADTVVAGGEVTSSVDIGFNEDVICTITNDDIAPKLTLVKEVSGGTALVTDWTLYADGTGTDNDFSGTSPVDSTTEIGAGFDAGTYDLSESAGPAGYTAGLWVCEGGADTDESDGLDIALDEDITCTIINTFVPNPTLTLVKIVTNDNGGALGVNDFGITTDAGTPSWDAGVAGPGANDTTYTSDPITVTPGSYSLDEDDVTGYTEGSWSCDNTTGASGGNGTDGTASVDVSASENVTCTIVNNDDAGTITVVKTVINDNGGTAVVEDFDIELDGTDVAFPDANDTGAPPTLTYSSDPISVTPGTYSLIELGVFGYDPTFWDCDNTTDDDTEGQNNLYNDASVTIALGEDVTCTITNDDIAPVLTLFKSVDNTGGGTASTDDWTLQAGDGIGNSPFFNGQDTGSGVVSPSDWIEGTFQLFEMNGPSNYTTTGIWDCNDGEGGTGSFNGTDFVTVEIGETLECTITNTFVPPSVDIELAKVVDDLTPFYGDTVTFTVTVTNNGPDTATLVEVEDLIPSGFTYVLLSANPSQGTFGEVNYIWDVGTLTASPAAGSSATLTFDAVVEVLPTPGTDDYCNFVQVYNVNETDSDDTNDEAEACVTPQQADPELSKTVFSTNQGFTDDPNVAIGEQVRFAVTMNIPPGVFTNVSLEDILPQGLSYDECFGTTVEAPLTTDVVGGFSFVCDNPIVAEYPPASIDPQDIGRQITWNLGTVTNTALTSRELVFNYYVIVLDVLGNQDGTSLTNSATFSSTETGDIGPVSATVDVLEPDLTIVKTIAPTFVEIGDEVTVTLTINHTAASNTNAYDVEVLDVLPAELAYVAATIDCDNGAQDPNVCDDTTPGTIRAVWDNFLLSGPGSGNGIITFRATVLAFPVDNSIDNLASVSWSSLPGDESAADTSNPFSHERYYDPQSLSPIYFANDTASIFPLQPEIPSTGFTPGVVTDLSGLSVTEYASTSVTLEIPKLKLSLPVAGVPLVKGGWDLNWLTGQVGWLEQTAFPGFNGNSVITSHITSSFGTAGPFANLKNLTVGDYITLKANGRIYTYAVREMRTVGASDLSVFKHEEKSWLTLVTCSAWNALTQTYDKRLVVSAVLIESRPAIGAPR